jgi:precorrin-2 dehydrogenase/sirohydrochlorin ferrochelatase
MNYYPILVDLEGKKALIVGGGRVAERKAETLLEYGASIDLVSKELTYALELLVEGRRITYLGPEFKEAFLDSVFIVVAATNDKQLNRKVSLSARRKGLLVNAVDQPQDCNFIVPSIVKRGDLLIAVSTSGKSPALSKKIRKDLENQFGEEYRAFLLLMGRLRDRILSRGLPQEENSRIFHQIVDSPLLKALSEESREDVRAILQEILPDEESLETVLADILKR